MVLLGPLLSPFTPVEFDPHPPICSFVLVRSLSPFPRLSWTHTLPNPLSVPCGCFGTPRPYNESTLILVVCYWFYCARPPLVVLDPPPPTYCLLLAPMPSPSVDPHPHTPVPSPLVISFVDVARGPDSRTASPIRPSLLAPCLLILSRPLSLHDSPFPVTPLVPHTTPLDTPPVPHVNRPPISHSLSLIACPSTLHLSPFLLQETPHPSRSYPTTLCYLTLSCV